MRGAAERATDAIRRESHRVGWPTRFQTDLDHDERAIAKRPGERFVWGLHDLGTHIAWPGGGLTPAMIKETFPECRLYVWNGEDELTHVASAEEAADLIAPGGDR